MMKKLSGLILLPSLVFLAACGDTIENQMGMDVVDSVADLPKCSGSNEGELAFVTDAGSTYICVDGDWVPSVSGEGAGFSCKTVELKDKSGLKIVCNGDSIGVVLNGEKGESGKDGNDGASGSGCSITDRNDTAVVVVCGDSTMTISLGVGQSGDSLEGDLDREPISLDSLAGYTQKGPFLKGSTVYLYELSDGRTLKQTNGNFTSSISSDDGRYKFSARDLVSQYAMVVVDGYYRNEVTGATSDATIRLKAITDMRKRSSVNVNLLTHMEYDRVYNLVTKEHKTVKKAKQQAQEEILNLFHIKLDGNADAEDMDVFGKTDADAALLAISVVLQGDRSEADLASLLAAFAADLADNGVWDNLRDRAQIADWAMKKTFSAEGLAAIRANVEGWGLGDGKAPAFEGMVTNFWETELKLGACSNDNAGSIKAIGNKYSSYYAKSDSLASEGDSSDVRLICAADGDTYAWRYATDIEKNTAPFTDVSEGLAKNGVVNTENVYVYDDGKWRRGAELDISLEASCTAGGFGKMVGKTSKTGTKWYTCDTDPVAWREATTEEADTAGFGVPTGEDPIVRIGNVDKSHIYVYENVWRYGTDLDLDKGLGPCVIDTMNHVRQLSGTTGSKGWYICAESEASVEGNRIPRAWRKATDFERDTYQWPDTASGTLQVSELSGLKYVFDKNHWRPVTDLESNSKLNACVEENKGLVRKGGESDLSWYKCSKDAPTIVEGIQVPYTWSLASSVEADTAGFGELTDVQQGMVRKGNLNNPRDNYYKFTGFSWRAATTFEMDSHDPETHMPWSYADDGDYRAGTVNENLFYVYDQYLASWRPETSELDHDPDLGGCTVNRSQELHGKSRGRVSFSNGKNAYYYCRDTMWVVASQARWDTYDQWCYSQSRSVVYGGITKDSIYVCDADTFRVLTDDERWAWNYSAVKDVRYKNVRCTADDQYEVLMLEYPRTDYYCKDGHYVWKGVSVFAGLGYVRSGNDSINIDAYGIGSQIWARANMPQINGIGTRIDGPDPSAGALFSFEEAQSICENIQIDTTPNHYFYSGLHTFRLPSKKDWEILLTNIGLNEGVKFYELGANTLTPVLLKEEGMGNDYYKFSALPAGEIDGYGEDGASRTVWNGHEIYWWTSEGGHVIASMGNDKTVYYYPDGYADEKSRVSVRCIANNSYDAPPPYNKDPIETIVFPRE